MYDNILYPTDGSAGSEAAAAHVRELASAFDATVHALHVIEAYEGGLGLSGAFDDGESQAMSGRSPTAGYISGHEDRPDIEDLEDEFTERAESLLETSTESFDGLDLTTAVEVGAPYSVILEYADDHDADLIVMGTHGRTGVERYLLGSVAEKVVRLSDTPVVTVRADEAE
jgi:nucleotide-binding universal stress UspA family protein